MNIEDVLPENRSRYNAALSKAIQTGDRVLTHADVQDIVDQVNQEKVSDGEDKFNLMFFNAEKKTFRFVSGLERLSPEVLVFFQSRARGFLVRHRLFSMLQYYYDREDRVVRAQAVARGILAR